MICYLQIGYFTFSNLSESLLCIGALVLIWMVFYGQLAETLFYLAVSRCRLHIKSVVVTSPARPRCREKDLREAELQDKADLQPADRSSTQCSHAGSVCSRIRNPDTGVCRLGPYQEAQLLLTVSACQLMCICA